MEIGGEKMRKRDQQGENERQCRKKWTGTRQNIWWAHTTYSNIKFHIVVVQNNVKEMYTSKVVVVVFFLLIFATVAKFLDQTTKQKRHSTK